MDAESLAQIERIVSRTEEKLRQELGGKTDALGASLRQELNEKVEGLSGNLGQLNDKVEGLSGNLGQLSDKVEGLSGNLGQLNDKVEGLSEKIEDVKRHAAVLHEDVLHRIDLVVEGHQALHQKIESVEARLSARIEHESLETRSLIQLS